MNRRRFLRQVFDCLMKSLAAAVGMSFSPSWAAAAGRRDDVADGSGAMPVQRATGGYLTLFLAGDVMTGRGLDQALPHPGSPEIDESSARTAISYVELAEQVNGPIPRPVGFDYIWGDALEELVLLAPAVRLINLETSITTSDDAWPDKAIHYRMHPDNTPCLTAAHIDGCTVANNHVLDYGYAGLTETLQSLLQAHIRSAGAGRNLAEAIAPAVFDTGNGRVLLFAAATRTSGVPREWTASAEQAGVNRIELYYFFVQQLAQQVRVIKQPGDIAVLALHWGSNWGYEVHQEQRQFAHRVIDEAGIDVLHGHSSHHPRGIEIYRNKAILYGCGDLINDYEGIPSQHDEFRSSLKLMYFPTLDPASGELVRFELIPMRMRRLRLQRASAEEAKWLTATLDRESRKMGTRAELLENGRIELTARHSETHVGRAIRKKPFEQAQTAIMDE